MRIITAQLRKFLQAASNVKLSPTATNLDCIKIESNGNIVTLSKTNNNTWLKYSHEAGSEQESEIYLINERMLNGIVAACNEYEIEISKKGKNVILDNGIDKVKTGILDLSIFPKEPNASGEKILLTKEAVARIKIAGNHVLTDSALTTNMSFVHLGINGIFATNTFIVYHHNTFPLPEAFFDQDVLSVLKGNSDVYYWSNGNYDFFEIEKFEYGFIKSEVKRLDYMPIISATGENYFTCKRQDVIDLCTVVQYSRKNENIKGEIVGIDEKTLQLKYADAEHNIFVERNISIESNHVVDPFGFVIDQVAAMLKTLPYETITFTKVPGGHYFLTTAEDQDYKGVIAKLMN